MAIRRALSRYEVLLTAGPEINREDRKRLRGFTPTPSPIAVAVWLALQYPHEIFPENRAIAG